MSNLKKEKTILFADKNLEFISRLSARATSILSDNFEISTKTILVENGNDILATIKDTSVDLIVMSGFLPQYSADDLLLEFSVTKDSIPVIAYSNSIPLGTKILKNGGEFLYEPFNLIALCHKIKLLLSPVEVTIDPQTYCRLERATMKVLEKTGILPHLTGYKLLKEALICNLSFNEDDTSTLNLKKTIYPFVGTVCSIAPANVEKNIRYLIEKAWDVDKYTLYSEIYGKLPPDKDLTNIKRPKNKALISLLSSKIQKELESNKKTSPKK